MSLTSHYHRSGVYVCPTCTTSTGSRSASEWIAPFLVLCTGVFCTPVSPLHSVVFLFWPKKNKKMLYLCSLLSEDGRDRSWSAFHFYLDALLDRCDFLSQRQAALRSVIKYHICPHYTQRSARSEHGVPCCFMV